MLEGRLERLLWLESLSTGHGGFEHCLAILERETFILSRAQVLMVLGGVASHIHGAGIPC